MEDSPQASVIRLSLRGVLLVFLIIFVVGLGGGLLGTYWLQPMTLPPLTEDPEQLVATVQEVTISPSKAAAELVAETQGSVLLLGQVEGGEMQPVATGAVVTNDGIVVTPAEVDGNRENLMAFDGEHEGIPVSFMGRDEVYGLTYFRLEEGVLAPFDLANDPPAVGGSLLEMGRVANSSHIAARKVGVQRYELVEPGDPRGWHRTVSTTAADETLTDLEGGNVLLADNGAIRAMRIDEGRAMSVAVIQESLQRLTRQEREYDVLDEWGMQLTYDFVYDEVEEKVEFVTSVANVTAGSPAAQAELAVGDRLVAINETDITWGALILPLLESDESSVSVQRERGDSLDTIVLQKSLAASP